MTTASYIRPDGVEMVEFAPHQTINADLAWRFGLSVRGAPSTEATPVDAASKQRKPKSSKVKPTLKGSLKEAE